MNELETAILDCNSRYFNMDVLQSMENAGRSVAHEVETRYGTNNRIGIFCGLGNNGGDGYVAARFLSEKNQVTVYVVGLPDNIKTDEAKRNWDILKYIPIKKEIIRDTKDISIPQYDIIVDALLGTGISGTLREPYKTLVDVLNEHSGAKVSIDIPTGYKTPTAFAADITISMHYPKTETCTTVSIGIPTGFEQLIGPGDVKFLQRRKKDSHKGDNGRILIVGGSELYHGAVIYAGAAASKVVDLVFIMCPQSVADIVKEASPDFIVHPLSSTHVVPGDIPRITDIAQTCDAVLLGPGIGTHPDTFEACRALLPELHQVTVIDADGLKSLKGNTEIITENMVLTPHHGEFALLFGDTPIEKASIDHTCTIVLKGPQDVISNGKTTRYNHTGNAGMTTGGTGDILAGLITGFAACNPLFQASCAAAFVNGKAGDMCYNQNGMYYTASDVIEYIQPVLVWCTTF
jgi:hydroxyethylthiazole kinase-like uncharacterized protein yjeF